MQNRSLRQTKSKAPTHLTKKTFSESLTGQEQIREEDIHNQTEKPDSILPGSLIKMSFKPIKKKPCFAIPNKTPGHPPVDLFGTNDTLTVIVNHLSINLLTV